MTVHEVPQPGVFGLDMFAEQTAERLREEGRLEMLRQLLNGTVSVLHPYTGELCRLTVSGAPVWNGGPVPVEHVVPGRWVKR